MLANRVSLVRLETRNQRLWVCRPHRRSFCGQSPWQMGLLLPTHQFEKNHFTTPGAIRCIFCIGECRAGLRTVKHNHRSLIKNYDLYLLLSKLAIFWQADSPRNYDEKLPSFRHFPVYTNYKFNFVGHESEPL